MKNLEMPKTNGALIYMLTARALLWIASCMSASFLITLASPHGTVAFFLTGCVLSVIGAIGQTIRSVLRATDVPVLHGTACSIIFGFGYGIGSFVLATLLFERAIHLPHDSYQWLLVLYLVLTAVAINYLVDIAFRASHGK